MHTKSTKNLAKKNIGQLKAMSLEPGGQVNQTKRKFVNNIFIQDSIDRKLATPMGQIINSPPVEPTNPHLLNNPRLKYLNTVITDEMIEEYQKLDNLLNLAIERVRIIPFIHSLIFFQIDEHFIAMVIVKTYLQFYFREYHDLVSPMVHKTSVKNMLFILKSSELCKIENCHLGIDQSLKNIPQLGKDKSKISDDFSFRTKTLSGMFGNQSIFNRDSLKSMKLEPEFEMKIEEEENALGQKIEEESYKVFCERIKRITDTLIHFLQNRVDLGHNGADLEIKVRDMKEFNQFTPTNFMFRRFVRIMQGVLGDCDDNSKLKEIMEERRGQIIDQLNKQYFNVGGPMMDIDTTQNHSLTIALSLKFCEKMLVSIINTAESYKQAFTEIAHGMSMVDIEDNVSLSERQMVFNDTTPNQFRQIVSQNGSNPLSKVYGLFQ